ncbi:ankyrin repeat-containing domain protein [Xylogone sp. PMI_703]|nr:ankyrin repeat-containing domain protein [Xylogone sp. PMI_703]
MKKMSDLHNFDATKSQYELQFKKWRFRKNVTAADWKTVACIIKRRKQEGEESIVTLYGNEIPPKRLRKQILRYGSTPEASEITTVSSLTIPPGFAIHTPSARSPSSSSSTLFALSRLSPPPRDFTALVPTELYLVLPYSNMSTTQMECFPFDQFYSMLNLEGNPFSTVLGSSKFELPVLAQGIYSGILTELRGVDGNKLSAPFSQTVEALMPQNILRRYVAKEGALSLNGQAPLLTNPMKLALAMAMYLLSNNIFDTTSDVSRGIYKWIKRPLNIGLLDNLLSKKSPSVEAFAESLFCLAIAAGDVWMVEKLIVWGISPNLPYHDGDRTHTSLQHASAMRSFKLVDVLIKKGADVNLSVGSNTTSALYSAISCRNDYDKGHIRGLVDVDLVQILLNAGANANPSNGPPPLAAAVAYGEAIPNKHVISIVKTLLDAGANPQAMATDVHSLLIHWHEDILKIHCPRTITVLDIAIRRKSAELINLLLERGAQTTEHSLEYAAAYGDRNTIELLQRYGAHLTEMAIKYAVLYNDTELVFILLKTADQETKLRRANAALIYAIEKGNIDLFKKLETEGAQLEDELGLIRAIEEAIKSNQVPILRFLLGRESKYKSILLGSLESVLKAACKAGRNDIANLFLEASVDMQASRSIAPLLVAVRCKNERLVRQLLSAGAAVNKYEHFFFASDNAVTVLPAAISWADRSLISEIIDSGADINALEDDEGKASLTIAVERGDWDIIELLIDRGADVNNPAATFSGYTALEAAVKNNNQCMVQYLLDLGADPDDISLLTAVLKSSVELVRIILSARLKRYKRISKGYGCLALQYAITLEYVPVIKLLLETGIDPDSIFQRRHGDSQLLEQSWYDYYLKGLFLPPDAESALGTAITMCGSDLSIVQMVLRKADPNRLVTDRRTALLAAIHCGNPELVKLLMGNGAAINSGFRCGVERTPLQLAVEKGRIDIVKILLNKGADVNAPPYNKNGATALQFAAIGGYAGIACLLLDYGADVNAPAAKNNGRTALEGAAEHGRSHMVELLLAKAKTRPSIQQFERALAFATRNGYRSIQQFLEKEITQCRHDNESTQPPNEIRSPQLPTEIEYGEWVFEDQPIQQTLGGESWGFFENDYFQPSYETRVLQSPTSYITSSTNLGFLGSESDVYAPFY